MTTIPSITAEDIHFAIAPKLRGGASHIEAILEYAHDNDMEVEFIAEIIKKSNVFKNKIFEEASERRLVKTEQSTLTTLE